jgi:type II secretory pathway component PulF
MKKYRCHVCSESGERNERVISAEDEETLLRHFRGTGFILLEYAEIAAAGYTIKNRITSAMVLSFTESMAALLSSGLSIQDALSICGDVSVKRQIRRLCAELRQAIVNGERFHQALSLFSPSFSPLYISLVRIGETTGSVERVFNKLTQYLRRQKEVKRKIIQAMAYPVTVCLTTVAVSFFIVIFVLPKMKIILEMFSTDISLSGVESGFNSITATITVMIASVMFLAALIVSFVKLRRRVPSLARRVDGVLLHIPLLGPLLKIFSAGDFAFSMDLLCSSGVTFMNALRQSAEVIVNRAFRHAVEAIAREIADGGSITRAFGRYNVFPDYVVSWVSIGERTGSVERIFSQIHAYFNSETENIISSVVIAAEPLFILLAGSMVVFMVWKFVLPVFSLIGGL